MRKTGIALLVIGTILFMFLAASSYLTAVRLLGEPERGARIINRIALLERIRDPLHNSRIAVRAYLLTGNEGYLVPYHEALATVRGNFNKIRQDYVKVPYLHERLDTLETLVNDRFGLLSNAIALRKKGEYGPAARKDYAERGAVLDSRIDAIIDDWVSEDIALSYRAGRELSGLLTSLIATALSGVVLSVVLLILILLLIRARNRAVIESESRLRGITSTAPDAVILIDNDGRVTFWNESAAKMFGYTSREIMGRFLHSLIMPDRHIDAYKRAFAAFRSTGQGPIIDKTYEIEGRRKDGAELPLELSLSALNLKGRWNAIGIVRDITVRKRLEEEIRHMAHHDPLTGLPNRRLFMDVMRIEIAQARRHRTKLALLFLDLDRFKEINDSLGHQAGDRLLKEVAVRLRESIRESDAVARIGGDEFNIVLAGITRRQDISEIAGKITARLQVPFPANGGRLIVTTSIGISVFPDDSEEIETLTRFADSAMYQAKQKGRNRFEFFNETINARNRREDAA